MNHLLQQATSADLKDWAKVCSSAVARLQFMRAVMDKTGLNRKDFFSVFGKDPKQWINLNQDFDQRFKNWAESQEGQRRTWARGIYAQFWSDVQNLKNNLEG